MTSEFSEVIKELRHTVKLLQQSLEDAGKIAAEELKGFEVYSKKSGDVKSFKVPGIGEFTPLLTESPFLSLNYASFTNIPPHYHEKTIELFQFLTPAFGSMVVGGKIEEENGEHYVSGGKTIKIEPYTTVYIPPFTPHRMKVDTPGYALAYLFSVPRFDGKDEVPLMVKKV